jgi:predicted PurR-regulated permease PerM
MNKKIDISHKTIIFTVLFLLGLWFLYYIRGIIIALFIAFLLMTMMDPLVGLFEKLKIKRGISVLISYILVIAFFGGVIALIIPPLIQQTTNFIGAFPGYLSKLGIKSSELGSISAGLLNQIGGVVNFTFSVFSNVISVVSILVFAFYMLLGHPGFKSQLTNLLGNELGENIGRLVCLVEDKLGRWSRGELLLMLAVALGNYIGYLILRIPYALPLAVLTGIFEIIPTLGPIISAVPAVLIGFGISPLTGIGVVAVSFLVNQLENYVLVPKIMQRSAGVSPLVVLISIAIGAKLAGVTGAIIAVPLVVTLQAVIKEYWGKEKT